MLGREDLDTLEGWVRELFSEVPNHDISPLQGVSPTENPFDAGWKQVLYWLLLKSKKIKSVCVAASLYRQSCRERTLSLLASSRYVAV